jgi:hypothetical protein
MNAKTKKQCQVVFMMLVVSLLLKQTDREAGDEHAKNPAIDNCTKIMDGILESMPDDTRGLALKRIDAHRIRFTKKIGELTTTSAVIGALRLLTSGYVKAKPGTHLHFVLQTFGENLANMEELLPFKETDAEEFERSFKAAVQKIGGKYSKRI